MCYYFYIYMCVCGWVGVLRRTLMLRNASSTSYRFIAQSHVDGNLPIMPLTQPLLPVLQQKVSSRGIIKKKDEENKGGFHDEQKDSACHETSALTNVIRYNDNARRILEEFQRFKQWKDERSVSDDELHFFFNLLKAA